LPSGDPFSFLVKVHKHSLDGGVGETQPEPQRREPVDGERYTGVLATWSGSGWFVAFDVTSHVTIRHRGDRAVCPSDPPSGANL
jgi:hypothetical protein